MGGIWVEDGLILKLSRVVNPSLAHKLKTAYSLRASVLNLSADERRAVLAVLEKPPPALEGLSEVLSESLDWRPARRIG